MRLRILSDLHLETGSWAWQPVGEDLVILAGDIADQSFEGQLRRQRLWYDLARASMPAIYIIGNHEGYSDWVPRDVLRRRLTAEVPANVRILDRDFCDIGEIRFMGCTLWTDFSLGDPALLPAQPEDRSSIMQDVESSISDFKYLCRAGQTPPERISSLDMATWHHMDRSWLTTQIAACRRRTVVITHFLPSPESIDKRYAGSRLNAYFATDCRSLMRKPVELWIHGHTHSSCDYRHNDVRVICNPRGYGGSATNPNFRNNLTVKMSIAEPSSPQR